MLPGQPRGTAGGTTGGPAGRGAWPAPPKCPGLQRGQRDPPENRTLARRPPSRALPRRARGRGEAGRPGRPGHLRQLSADRVPGAAVPGLCHLQRLPARPGGVPPLPLPPAELSSASGRCCWANWGWTPTGTASWGRRNSCPGTCARPTHGPGRGVRLLVDGRLVHWRPSHRGLGLRHHAGGPLAQGSLPRPARDVRAAHRGAPAGDTARLGRGLHATTAGRTLDQCLRSLLALDYPDYEVILVDDGSTDDTRTIAARYPRGATPSIRPTGA